MTNNDLLYAAIDNAKKKIENSQPISLSEFAPENTVLVIVDMVNGFAKSGALYSPNTEKINEPIAKFALCCEAHSIPVIAFCDSHNDNSAEFSAFPKHCIKDSEESRLTDEIASSANIKVFLKNSTNGYVEEEFRKWLDDNSEINTFIVTGCCTDLCIQQLSLSLKAHFNAVDRESRIIVPLSMTATYDTADHNAEFCSLTALYNMGLNSIEIVSDFV